tara:strand:- start:1950 stop:2939 length:990 start_codon:yes stop_codon:yes gene_type:complete
MDKTKTRKNNIVYNDRSKSLKKVIGGAEFKNFTNEKALRLLKILFQNDLGLFLKSIAKDKTGKKSSPVLENLLEHFCKIFLPTNICKELISKRTQIEREYYIDTIDTKIMEKYWHVSLINKTSNIVSFSPYSYFASGLARLSTLLKHNKHAGIDNGLDAFRIIFFNSDITENDLLAISKMFDFGFYDLKILIDDVYLRQISKVIKHLSLCIKKNKNKNILHTKLTDEHLEIAEHALEYCVNVKVELDKCLTMISETPKLIGLYTGAKHLYDKRVADGTIKHYLRVGKLFVGLYFLQEIARTILMFMQIFSRTQGYTSRNTGTKDRHKSS